MLAGSFFSGSGTFFPIDHFPLRDGSSCTPSRFSKTFVGRAGAAGLDGADYTGSFLAPREIVPVEVETAGALVLNLHSEAA